MESLLVTMEYSGALKYIEIPCAACRIYEEQAGSNSGEILIFKAIL
jgi:hypothetical protein